MNQQIINNNPMENTNKIIKDLQEANHTNWQKSVLAYLKKQKQENE